jgi:hypothetical protein
MRKNFFYKDPVSKFFLKVGNSSLFSAFFCPGCFTQDFIVCAGRSNFVVFVRHLLRGLFFCVTHVMSIASLRCSRCTVFSLYSTSWSRRCLFLQVLRDIHSLLLCLSGSSRRIKWLSLLFRRRFQTLALTPLFLCFLLRLWSFLNHGLSHSLHLCPVECFHLMRMLRSENLDKYLIISFPAHILPCMQLAEDYFCLAITPHQHALTR